MKKTKVFFFCPALIAGGLERVLSVLSGTLASHYDEVTYITWHNLPVFYDIDIRVKVVCAEKECSSHSVWKRMKWLRRYVKRERPDIVISFSTPFNMISLAALVGVGVKVVISERNDPAHFRWGWLAKKMRDILYSTADGILVQTETCKKHLSKRLAKTATIIPNPVLMGTKYIGCALNSEKDPTIVTVARLVPQKRLDMLINAFAQFHFSHPNYHLAIYGEGNEREFLQKLIYDMQLTKAVSLYGAVGNIWEKMKCAEMFVMASEYEGMSNALIEAMCLGLPCISTKVSGAVDLIRDGENGLLIDVGDEKGLLKCMRELADNSQMRLELGKNATEISKGYNLYKVIGAWYIYIDQIIGNESYAL